MVDVPREVQVAFGGLEGPMSFHDTVCVWASGPGAGQYVVMWFFLTCVAIVKHHRLGNL